MRKRSFDWKNFPLPKSTINVLIRLLFIVFAVFTAAVPSVGCRAAHGGEGFAIYLTKDNILPAEMESQSHVELAEPALIGIDDIISYNKQTYEMKLTADAYERILNLEVPTTGLSFMVCVDRNPIYWGAFWTPISSQSFDGVTIWKPLNENELYVITFTLGYPSSSFYDGKDPRNESEIIGTFKETGKLIEALNISDIKTLPQSMKGYELYSWQEKDGWHFTLITGTNRNKTLEEITRGESIISETGWINIHCTGEDAIVAVVSKVPAGEWITWHDGAFVSGGNNFELPPLGIIDKIRRQADKNGVDFYVRD